MQTPSTFALRHALAVAWLGLLLLAQPASAQPVLTGEWKACASVKVPWDGDTFVCQPAGGPPYDVRVASEDAPERDKVHSQYRARAAHKRLKSLVGAGTQVACYKIDQYKRAVCRVKTATGQDVAAEMITAGLGWYTEQWAQEDPPADQQRYRQLEAKARGARVGLWGMPDPMSPWDCRRAKDAGKTCR